MSDERLCERVGVDKTAQDALFLRHIEPVTLFLMQRFSGIEHEAIAAEALTDALCYVGKHGMRKSFRALLWRVALQYGWKAKKHTWVHGQNTATWDILAEQPSPVDFAARVQEEVVLAQALQGLTDWERACLMLRYVDELSEAEIARQSGRTLSAVKSSLHHARQKLRADRMLTELYYRERKLSMQGWFLAGGNPQNYEIGVTRNVMRSDKPSGYLRHKGGNETAGFGTLMQNFRAEKYLNKRMRFSGYVKVESVVQKAGLWMRVDGPVLNKHLSFGILLTGPGEVWLTELQFEEVGDGVPVTGANRMPPTEPQNLGFEVE